MTPVDNTKDKSWLFALIAVLATVSAFGLATGYVFPAVSLRIIHLDGGATVNGLQAGFAGLGLILGSVMTPIYATRIGSVKMAFLGLIASAIFIAVCGLIVEPVHYLAIRFLLGVSTSVLFIISETWINQLAPDHLRGRIVGIYTTIIAGTFGLGPLLIPLIGYIDPLPWMLVGGIILFLTIPLVFLRGQTPKIERARISHLVSSIRKLPILLFAVGTFGYVDGAVLGLWPVYAHERTVPDELIPFMIFAFVAGSMFFQIPLGALADKTSNRFVMRCCAIFCIFAAFAVPFISLNETYIWVHLVVFGGIAFGIYTLCMAMIGKHLSGPELMSANAAFGITWGIGSATGASATGIAMEMISIESLPVGIGLTFAILAIALAFGDPIRGMRPVTPHEQPEGR